MKSFDLLQQRSHTKKQRSASVRLEVELLEARNLLSAPPTNVLVNNPAEDTTAHDTQSETAIVLGANSNVVVAYNDDDAFSLATPTQLGYSLSTNLGGSFTDKGSLPDNPPYWPGFDPVLARSSKTGTILMSSNSVDMDLPGAGERVLIYRSADNGASFSAPLNGTPGFVAGVDQADKPWIAVDNYPGPGYGNVYLAWTRFSFTKGTDEGIYFTRSIDDGASWGPSGGVPIDVKSGSNAVQGAFVTVGPDHTVDVFWWYGDKSENILMSKSIDQGQTFSDPVIVTRLRTNGGDGDLGLTNSSGQTFRTNAYAQAAVNPMTGDIYVVYNDKPKSSTDKADIFFTESADAGATWSAPLRVNDDNTTNDQWMPALALTPDGSHLGIFWYDRRLDPADNLIDRFGVIGTVSGHTVTFSPNFRIIDVSFPPVFNQDPLFVAAGFTTYMGDYDMAAADNNYFYTTWGDNRLPDAFFANQPDVRIAKIPVSQDDTGSLALVVSSSVVPGTSGMGQSTAGSLNNSASLLVAVANAMEATTPANATQPASQSGATVLAVPASPPAAPMDASAGQIPGPSISQLNPAAAMKALELVFAGEGEDGLSDGLILGLTGS